MIPRYEDLVIAEIWKDEAKLAAWQKVELAVIEARVRLGLVHGEIFLAIDRILGSNPVDIKRWKVGRRKRGTIYRLGSMKE